MNEEATVAIIRLSRGETLVCTLTDPDGVLPVEGRTGDWKIQPKVTKVVTWTANRKSKTFPLIKQWDMPTPQLRTLPSEGRFVVPLFLLPNSFDGTNHKLDIHVIFSLLLVLINDSMEGTSPSLTSNVHFTTIL